MLKNNVKICLDILKYLIFCYFCKNFSVSACGVAPYAGCAYGNHSGRDIGGFYSLYEGAHGFSAEEFFIDRKGRYLRGHGNGFGHVIVAYHQRIARNLHIQ